MSKKSLFKSILKFCLPNRYKFVVWLILSSLMLGQYQEEFMSVKGKKHRQVLIKVEWYGKPVVYYKKEKRPGVFYPDRLALVLGFAWALTLCLLAIFLLMDRIVSGSGFRQRGKALMVLVLLVVLPYFALYIVGSNLLIRAVVKRYAWQVSLLSQLGISPNRLSLDDIDFPLKEAAWNKDHKMAKKLIQLGANIKMANKFGDTALHSAAYQNAIKVARYLIRLGANVNAIGKDGNTPLHRAHSAVMVKLLLNNGAHINLRNDNKRTAIFTDKQAASITLLIARGATMRLADKQGNTVLHYVQKPGDVAPLIKAGADVNFRNKLGQTPLHMLVPTDKSSLLMAPLIAEKLIEHGAKPDIPDKFGMSPLHYAIRFCNPRSRSKATIATGKILFKASAEVRLQLKNRKLFGQLALIVKENKTSCWKAIAGNKATLLIK